MRTRGWCISWLDSVTNPISRSVLPFGLIESPVESSRRPFHSLPAGRNKSLFAPLILKPTDQLFANVIDLNVSLLNQSATGIFFSLSIHLCHFDPSMRGAWDPKRIHPYNCDVKTLKSTDINRREPVSGCRWMQSRSWKTEWWSGPEIQPVITFSSTAASNCLTVRACLFFYKFIRFDNNRIHHQTLPFAFL